MAGSRLEKVGTIFNRVTGLIQSKALNYEDRPIWYDVYAAFPPKDEPRFDRPTPNIKLKNIFYEDDKIRAIFHANNKQIGATHLLSDSPSLTQRFIDTYKKVQALNKDGLTDEQIYKEAVDILSKERGVRKTTEIEEDDVNLTQEFKKAQKRQEQIDIKSLFNM